MRNTFILLFISIFIVGCATILSGTTQQVTFQSSPSGALVKINGRPLGKTPLTIQLDKESSQTLVIEKDGYKSFTTSMDTSLDPWFWGNILIGGVLGSTTDGVSGAINKYSPGQYIITLEPLSADNYTSNMYLSNREYARRFLYLNYEKLRKDLSNGSGEVIDASFKLLKISKTKKGEAITNMKSKIFIETDASSFIEKTLNKYLG